MNTYKIVKSKPTELISGTPKIARGYVTNLPCRKRRTGKRHIRVVYENKVWEILEYYFRCGREIQQLPFCVPAKILGVDIIEYQYEK